MVGVSLEETKTGLSKHLAGSEDVVLEGGA